ncbi:transposase [Kistimonas scapharcae]
MFMSTDLTDSQWEYIEPFIPSLPIRADRRGRSWITARDVLNGILWVLRTGSHWYEMPDCYPPYQTCHRRFQQWVKQGVMDCLLEALAEDLERRGQIDLNECFIDGSFSSAKKGGTEWEQPKEARVPRSWRLQTVMVFLSPYGQQVLRHMKHS